VNCSVLTQAEIWVHWSSEVARRTLLRCRHRTVRVESISSSVMNRIRKLFIISLFACLLASTRASSQTNTGYAAANASSLEQAASAQVVPSNSASASATSIQGGHFNSQTSPRKPAHAGTVRGSLTMGAIPGESPSLCFLPGIGWQRIPISPFRGTEKVSTTATPGGGASGGMGADEAVTGGSSSTLYTEPSGTKHSTSSECPGTLTNTMAPAVAIDDGMGGKQAQVLTSVRAASMNAGAQDWLRANSVLNPASGAASQRLTMGLTSMPTDGTHVLAGSRSGVSAAQVNGLKAHAYVSSLALRRMMRSAPDLETRIKLQELQDYLAKKSRISTVTSTKDKAKTQSQKQRAHSRPYSSSISIKYGHGTNSARTAHSHTP